MAASSLSSSTSSKPSNDNRKISWPEALSVKQSFSFPDSIIYYISKNPTTPKRYYKLVKSCKYFFEKLPLLIVSWISENGTKICKRIRGHKKDRKCCINIDANKLNSKIWPTKNISFDSKMDSNIFSRFCSKLHPSDTAFLSLCRCSIAFDDFKKIASAFQTFWFDGIQVMDNNGNDVMLEKILESIPILKEIEYAFKTETPNATASTMKNIAKLQNLGNTLEFFLTNIPGIIPVRDFSDFIKDHKDTKIWFEFNKNISKEYKNQVDKVIDDIIASKIPRHIIDCEGQDEEKLKIMDGRFMY